MKHAPRTSVIVLTLLAVIAISAPASASKADNSVRFAYLGSLQSVDPNFNTQILGTIVAVQVWDTLIQRNPETGDYEGNLATAWRWIDDRTLELDLRQGVKFHNGAEFDADDVVFSLNFASKPEFNSMLQARASWIGRVEKLDRYKVRIFAKQTSPAAIASLAFQKMAILPHRYYAEVGPKGMNTRPVDTGPYCVVDHALGKHVRLERNADYFKGGPKARPTVERVEIRFLPDAQTQVAEVIAGGLDLIMFVDRDQAEQLRDVRNIDVLTSDSRSYALLRLNTLPNTLAPQLRDVRVRQAIAHAIDRETIAKYIVGEGARVLHAECHPSQFGCDDTGVPIYPYDPAKARQLLAEAGYKNGFDIDLYAFVDRIHTEAIIGYLGAVGIRAHPRYLRTAAVTDALRAGKVSFVYFSATAQDDIAISAQARFHNFSSEDINQDPEVRDLMRRGDTSMDPEVRKEAYNKALEAIAERSYAIPLYASPAYYIAAKGLVFKPPADDIPRFYEMSWK
jgi:peptide/nickel transport system substrate-binding protein